MPQFESRTSPTNAQAQIVPIIASAILDNLARLLLRSNCRANLAQPQRGTRVAVEQLPCQPRATATWHVSCCAAKAVPTSRNRNVARELLRSKSRANLAQPQRGTRIAGEQLPCQAASERATCGSTRHATHPAPRSGMAPALRACWPCSVRGLTPQGQHLPAQVPCQTGRAGAWHGECLPRRTLASRLARELLASNSRATLRLREVGTAFAAQQFACHVAVARGWHGFCCAATHVPRCGCARLARQLLDSNSRATLRLREVGTAIAAQQKPCQVV